MGWASLHGSGRSRGGAGPLAFISDSPSQQTDRKRLEKGAEPGSDSGRLGLLLRGSWNKTPDCCTPPWMNSVAVLASLTTPETKKRKKKEKRKEKRDACHKKML